MVGHSFRVIFSERVDGLFIFFVFDDADCDATTQADTRLKWFAMGQRSL